MEAQPAETYWTLTQGRDAHPGDGHSPGGDFHPERDTRQEGILTRRGHLPGGDTHQRGTLTHGRGHSPGGDIRQGGTPTPVGTLTREGHSPMGGDTHPGGHRWPRPGCLGSR